jgi:adenosylmethionine---8-amino-7-oxononanoate aminotransferase
MIEPAYFQACSAEELIAQDRKVIWHPYCASHSQQPLFAVAQAEGCRLHLLDGRILVDGMASWWASIHGYNHPVLNNAVIEQTKRMAHVMFGGLTHAPAVELATRLLQLAPSGLERVFFVDSGSVAVEVALKMALQYWQGRGQPQKQTMLCLKQGYHGDTLGAMSISDPDTGMHSLFGNALAQHLFTPELRCRFSDTTCTEDAQQLEALIAKHHTHCAALVLEPIVQGAGGMRFYSPAFLKVARELCTRYGLLLIADEIATGFGRTGRMFACEHADISPDILCLGKALTGGYMTLAATLCSEEVASGISASAAGIFMHGPTFMANPLACALANANLRLLEDGQWQHQVATIAAQLTAQLEPLAAHSCVHQVRVLGAIGVIEFNQPLDLNLVQPAIVEQGVWLRPFGKLLYTMPPFVIAADELTQITRAMAHIVQMREQQLL